MTRYFVTHQTATLLCDQVTVTMRSSTSQHLWLLATTKPPYIRPRPFRGQQSERPHQNNFSLEIQIVSEQEEPGNTLTHTFVFTWPFQAQTVWFYAINQGTGSIKATRTPIFVYQISETKVLEETWGTSGQPDLPWVFQADFQQDTPIYGGGHALIRQPLKGRANLDLDLTPYLGTIPNSFCNLYIRVKFGTFSPFPTMSETEPIASLIYRNANGLAVARNGYTAIMHDPCVWHPNNYVIPVAPSSTIGFPPTYMHEQTISLCGDPINPPISDPYLAGIQLSWVMTGPDPSGPWLASWGGVYIGTTGGQLIDISGQWRNKRLSPFLP